MARRRMMTKKMEEVLDHITCGQQFYERLWVGDTIVIAYRLELEEDIRLEKYKKVALESWYNKAIKIRDKWLKENPTLNKDDIWDDALSEVAP